MFDRNFKGGAIGMMIVAITSTSASAGFLDLTGFSGTLVDSTFTGTIDGVSVSGKTPFRSGNGISTFSSGDSTFDGTSPQFSYTSVYSPTTALADRVGFAAYPGFDGRFTITFGAPLSNLQFHVAALDGAAFAFDLTGGLNSVSLVSGNGGNGEGLQVVGSTVSDANPATFGGEPNMYAGNFPMDPPPLTGARPAYGTVSLNGTYTTLTVNVTSIGDTGSFTLSSIPEPTALAALGTVGLALLRRRRG